MKRFILKTGPDKNGIIRLEGEDYHYLVRVRRLAVGESLPALLPSGDKVLVRIISAEGGLLSGECIPEQGDSNPVISEGMNYSDIGAEQTGLPPIVLFQALPKGEKMDLIVRQASEVGISEIFPYHSEFTIPKLKNKNNTKKFNLPDGEISSVKLSRWQRIIREARQQSGSKIATSIRRPLTVSGLFDYWDKIRAAHGRLQVNDREKALGLLFHHQPVFSKGKSGQHSNQGLEQESLHGYLNNIPSVVVMAVGPEGGFSEKEVSLFLENDFKPFTIGDAILRTETAALYCAAAVRILLLEKESWELKQTKNHSA